MIMQYFILKSLPYYLVVSYLVLLSLFDKETLKQKILLVIIIMLFLIVIVLVANSSAVERLLFFIVHGFILLRVIHMMGLDLIKTQSLNGFLVALVFYELLTLTKFFNFLIKVADVSAQTNFYIVTGVQIALGIFFVIFKEDDRRIRVRLE